jgi:hypothetical protein
MKRIFRRFLGSPDLETPLDRVSFDPSGFTPAAGPEGVRVWHSPEGDGIALHYFALPPDLPSRSTSREFEAAYRDLAEAAGASLVESAIRTIGDFRFVRAIVKVPQGPTGMTYVGSLTIPFRDFSYVVKVQCEEVGTTGVREAMLMAEALSDGSVQFDESEMKISGDWNPDNPRFDERFPEHPLSRLRALLASITATLNVDDRLSTKPLFALPT